MIKAVIFDMDGVISDTQKIHSQVESDILAKFGVTMSPQEISQKYSGVKTSEFFQDLLQVKKAKYELRSLLQEKWKKMSDTSEIITEIPGATALIKKLHASGIILALASSSHHNYVEQVLNKLEIKTYFQAIISGDMVAQGKPDPEIFLLAAKTIKISPKDCVVIEDGINGMLAARAAGMKCIALVANANTKYPCRNLVDSLALINQRYLQSLK